MSGHYDAIVIGAGPAGTAAAICLARQGRSVAIIERSNFPRRKVCGEFTSAINIDLLDRLGVGQQFKAQAGPEVKRLALFAAGLPIEAPMPQADGTTFGRALGRDVLDGLLLDAARSAGATVFQPFRAVEITRRADISTVAIESEGQMQALLAPVIIAAHGSWEQGRLPSNLGKINQPQDFLGFKAHFKGAALASDLMPLIAFPGGYGGMVWSDHDRLSLSFCIRRDRLTSVRSTIPGKSAAEAALAHIMAFCPGVADTLHGAMLDESWLAAGPIRPGIRSAYDNDIFRVGNIAGESHPIIAEGIAIALQSGWLLADQLARLEHWDEAGRQLAGTAYRDVWRKQFSTRIRLASILSAIASFPPGASLMRAVVSRFPASLSLGARLSGKTKPLPIDFVRTIDSRGS